MTFIFPHLKRIHGSIVFQHTLAKGYMFFNTDRSQGHRQEIAWWRPVTGEALATNELQDDENKQEEHLGLNQGSKTSSPQTSVFKSTATQLHCPSIRTGKETHS